jgi:hypothetical protein
MRATLPVTGGTEMQQPVSERRTQTRNQVNMWAVVRREGSMVREKIVLANISRDGFKMRSVASFAAKNLFFLELAPGLMTEVEVVRCDPALSEYGCRFLCPLPLAIVQRVLDQAEPPREIAA